MDKEFKDFCKLATDTWGEDAQIRMCIEEMSELTKELCKYMRVLRNENVDPSKLEEIKEEYDLIIPVPISKERLKEREFNQTEVLCNEIIKSGKVRNDILSRIKDTPHQTGLSRENRESNLKDSFVVNDKKQIKGKKILIIDDIYTTGSTINECANVLIKNGAKSIIALCLARTPIKLEKIVH